MGNHELKVPEKITLDPVTHSYQVTKPDENVLVDTGAFNNATLTLMSSPPDGAQFAIRIYAGSSGGVTMSPSGTDTILLDRSFLPAYQVGGQFVWLMYSAELSAWTIISLV